MNIIAEMVLDELIPRLDKYGFARMIYGTGSKKEETLS
jgi:hypothetical protein